MSRHYDVVVLGRSLPALAAAAVLARRDFRVLLLGQGERPPHYRFDRHRLKRRAFTLLFGPSPVWRKILHELAQTQTFRRRLEALDPMFSFLTDQRRVELPPDLELFGSEIDREFPEVRQLVDEFYTHLASANTAIDAAFERELTWPPGSFFERLEAARIVANLPLSGTDAATDLLAKFPPGHVYRRLAILPALFASDLDSGEDLVPLSLARLHGSWIRGLFQLPGGEEELEQFLLERIAAHGGEARLSERAVSIVIRGRRVAGVMLDGADEPLGTGALLSTSSGEKLAELAGGEGVTSRARRNWPELTATAGRFVTNVVVKTAALPPLLGHEAFVVSETGPAPAGRQDLAPESALHLQRYPTALAEETLLVAEMIVRRSTRPDTSEARAHVLAILERQFPFLDRHLVLVDSPHDGLPLYDYGTGQKREIDRIHVPESGSGAEPMELLWTCDPPGFLEVGAEPLRGPLPGSYLIGKTVVPGLGQEGALLAAFSVARLLTKKDSIRQKRRRQMWTKVETD